MSDEHSIDFLREKYQLAPQRGARKRRKNFLRASLAAFGVLAIAGAIFSYQISRSGVEPLPESSSFSLFSSVKRLILSDEKDLIGEEDDRINFLLLGVGGTGHDGPDLSDTIIFSSFRPSTSEIGMLSIPRDLAVPIPGYGYRKVNHINAYGELEEPGSGPEFATDVLGELLDQEIHYSIKVDFDGFENLIDVLGGVDIYIERSFTDYQYPTEDGGYMTISFNEGWQHLDGGEALEFTRSRHGTNGEGSDFARAARQQQVLLAVKDELMSPSVLLNPGKLNNLIEAFQDTVKTNLTFWEIIKLARYAPDMNFDAISHVVLDSSAESPLYSTMINGAYVLLPKRDDWSEVQTIASTLFEQEGYYEETESAGAVPIAQTVNIEIQNGTGVSGLAFATTQLLDGTGFEVVKIGNAESRDYEKTIIYDLSEGTLGNELGILQDFFEAEVSMSASGWIFSDEVVPRELSITSPGENLATSEETIDFLIILGEDTAQVVMR